MAHGRSNSQQSGTWKSSHEVRAIRADRFHDTATTLAMRPGARCGVIKLPFQVIPAPDLIRGLAPDSCFFGTNQPLRWVRGERAITESELSSCWPVTDRPLDCLGPTGPSSTLPPDLPLLASGRARGFLCKTPASTGRASLRSASLVSLPQNRPPLYPPPQARVEKGLETSSRRSRGESLTLEELL
jgi:hypothetical protein